MRKPRKGAAGQAVRYNGFPFQAAPPLGAVDCTKSRSPLVSARRLACRGGIATTLLAPPGYGWFSLQRKFAPEYRQFACRLANGGLRRFYYSFWGNSMKFKSKR